MSKFGDAFSNIFTPKPRGYSPPANAKTQVDLDLVALLALTRTHALSTGHPLARVQHSTNNLKWWRLPAVVPAGNPHAGERPWVLSGNGFNRYFYGDDIEGLNNETDPAKAHAIVMDWLDAEVGAAEVRDDELGEIEDEILADEEGVTS